MKRNILEKWLEKQRLRKLPRLRTEFKKLKTATRAMQKLLDDYSFKSVLDIGTGEGLHADVFLEHGKQVTAIDFGNSIYFDKNKNRVSVIVGDFNKVDFSEKFDCVWCSHILEHQLNTGIFLGRIHDVLNEGGVLAITVPPGKNMVVGGHVGYWNGGLLLYNLVMAGFDCSTASILRYGYNISLLVVKRAITLPTDLAYDAGDLRRLRGFLPERIKYHTDDSFDGDIRQLNW